MVCNLSGTVSDVSRKKCEAAGGLSIGGGLVMNGLSPMSIFKLVNLGQTWTRRCLYWYPREDSLD